MNLILVRPEDFIQENQARLFGERATHIRSVHRAKPGDILRVGLLGGPVGEGQVLALDEGSVVLSLRWLDFPPAPSAIELLLALPRPKMLRKILAAVTSMGVKRIVLINSFRVEKSYFDSPFLSEESIEKELCNGLSQARDTILPHVVIRTRFKPFIEDELASFWPSNTRKLLAHPDASKDLWGTLPVPTRDPAVIAIGPEGGWIPYEVEQLESRGFARFSVGPRILRVDTAVSFLLGQLELLWRRPVSSRAPTRE